MIAGGCLCKTVRWELDDEIGQIYQCHCSICRKANGAAYGVFAQAADAAFRFTQGEDNLGRFESSPGMWRFFCRTCGSPLPVSMGGQVIIPVGNIDGDPGARPSLHIFVGSKAAWHEITDALPQHRGVPAEWGEE